MHHEEYEESLRQRMDRMQTNMGIRITSRIPLSINGEGVVG